MSLLSIEQSRAAYRVDLALYAVAVASMSLYLLFQLAWGVAAPQRWAVALWILAGLVGWTLAEYVLHRFVLHGMPPFRAWHAVHHARPTALVFAPTVLSGSLILGLVFMPAWWLCGWLRASALTLGALTGYLAYTITHHTIHNDQLDIEWLRRRRRWHARHHAAGPAGRYGVTTGFWDRAFGTDRQLQ